MSFRGDPSWPLPASPLRLAHSHHQVLAPVTALPTTVVTVLGASNSVLTDMSAPFAPSGATSQALVRSQHVRARNRTPIPTSIITPINISTFASLIDGFPDRRIREEVLHGLTHGFDIGFNGLGIPTTPRNLRSARENAEAVSAAVQLEVDRGHTAGPFDEPPFAVLHCSPLGAAPKKDGSVRLVLDLSSPRGCAINEGISREEFSVQYSSFDDAVNLVRTIGTSAFLAKLDIKHAFRICPVRLDQLHLLGYRWLGLYYVDLRLPFGSRSSPYIFNNVAQVLAWALVAVCGIIYLLHYLDDFFICVPDQRECARYMDIFLRTCHDVGIPVAQDKTEGPTQVITYLGIEIDALHQVIRLPEDKLMALTVLLDSWVSKKKCTRRELESLIGSLSFAAKVVKPGRLFLRRLIDLSTTVASRSFFIDLNREAREDILWWHRFLRTWNGVEFFTKAWVTSQDLLLFTDASKLGMGAVFGNAWFSVEFPERFHALNINVLELFAVVAAVFAWGDQWKNSAIQFFTDNMCILHVWSRGSSKDKQIMTLLRLLFFFCAEHNIYLQFSHVAGKTNIDADDLSRFQVAKFKARNPQAEILPTAIPACLWTFL